MSTLFDIIWCFLSDWKMILEFNKIKNENPGDNICMCEGVTDCRGETVHLVFGHICVFFEYSKGGLYSTIM